jgi:hypothetical protein
MKITKKVKQYPTTVEQIVRKKLDDANEALSKTDLSKLGLKSS